MLVSPAAHNQTNWAEWKPAAPQVFAVEIKPLLSLPEVGVRRMGVLIRTWDLANRTV